MSERDRSRLDPPAVVRRSTRESPVRRACDLLGVCALLTSLQLSARSAHAESPSALSPPATPQAESESRLQLGLRAFGGGLFAEGERTGGGGGAALAAFALVPERWELELGLSLVAARHRDLLGVVEVLGKRVFARGGDWAPHLLAGPALSLDFGNHVRTSAGVVFGGGVTHWFRAHLGAVIDGAYRLLVGAEVEHVLTLALGVNIRF